MKFGGIFRRETVVYWSLFSQVLSALGVIASVAYLGVQISGSTEALKSQTHYNALVLMQRPGEMLVANQELAEIVELGERDADALSPSQFKRFAFYEIMSFNGWEYAYLLNKEGAIPTELAHAADQYYSELIRTQPGLRKFWSEYRIAWTDPFLSYVDGIFERNAPAGHGPETRSVEPSK